MPYSHMASATNFLTSMHYCKSAAHQPAQSRMKLNTPWLLLLLQRVIWQQIIRKLNGNMMNENTLDGNIAAENNFVHLSFYDI